MLVRRTQVLNARGMSNKAVALVGFIVTVSCACSTAICIVVFGLLALPLFSVALVWAAACLAGARTVYTVCATIATVSGMWLWVWAAASWGWRS